MCPAGYSKTPLWKKLGIKEGLKLYVSQAPEDYDELVAPLPEGVTIRRRLSKGIDIAHVFVLSRRQLVAGIDKCLPRIQQNGMIWISWPKKSSKVVTDVTEGVVRDVALPLGLVDVKVCAVDDTWSALKLVIRKELRR